MFVTLHCTAFLGALPSRQTAESLSISGDSRLNSGSSQQLPHPHTHPLFIHKVSHCASPCVEIHLKTNIQDIFLFAGFNWVSK